jgi:molybdate transport system substrate-binding protein
VFAAASLTGTFTELGRQFEAAHPGTTVTFSFGASSTLAQEILAGAPADVFASASATNMEQVTDAGDAADPRTFAKNVAEIAVSPASASRVTSLADLARPGVKVALCQPQVPCGALAQSVFAKAGVTVRPVTQGLDVKSTLAYVTGGEADAAIVYATDVRAAGDAVVGVEVPAAQNASTAYPIATLKGSRNAALAAQFEDFVLSAAGQAVLARAGFRAP